MTVKYKKKCKGCGLFFIPKVGLGQQKCEDCTKKQVNFMFEDMIIDDLLVNYP